MRDAGQDVRPKVALEAACELTDEELGGVTGGYSIGDWVQVDGLLYQTTYAEYCNGQVKGTYKIQRYIPGRAAPYLLDPWVGWVMESAIVGVVS